MRGSRLALLSSLVLLGCLAVPAYCGTIRDDRDPQSYLDLGASSAFACVGRVDGTTPSYSFLASGTLIAPDWVLTAAHVVKGTTSLTFTIDGTAHEAVGWVANSKFNSGNLGAGNDIGLIHLATPVSSVAPATLYNGSAELGAVGSSVGYGMTGTGLTGYITDWSDIQKRAGQNMVDAFYPVRRGAAANVILMDFDQPGDPTESSYGSATPLDLEYLIAPGDSGGGLFADLGGATQLIGVHSFGWGRLDGDPDSDYGDVSGDTRVSAFISWINGAMSAGTGGKGGGKGHKNATAAEVILGDYEYCFLDGTVAVPEPASFCLLALGGLALIRRRR